MSDKGDVFNKESEVVEPSTSDKSTEQTSSGDVYDAVLASILNDEGNPKYDSVEKALSSIAPSQAHINKIEKENAALREELEKRMSAEDLLNKFKKAQEEATTSTPGTVTLEEVANIVESTLSKAEKTKFEDSNQKAVNDSLVEQFGTLEVAAKKLQTKAEELGLSMKEVKELASKSPKVVLSWFPKSNSGTPPKQKSSVVLPTGGNANDGNDINQVFKNINGPKGNIKSAWEASKQEVIKRLEGGN